MSGRTWDPDVLVAVVGEPKRAVARRLKVDVANLCRPLTDRQADRYAIALGFLPWEVWGMAWLEDPRDARSSPPAAPRPERRSAAVPVERPPHRHWPPFGIGARELQ